MRSHRLLVLLAALAILAGAWSLAFTLQSSPASAKCWPNRVNNQVGYHNGWYTWNGSAWGGIYGQIFEYSPWVQPDPLAQFWSSAWVMLNWPSGAGSWAQIGWVEFQGDDRRMFSQVLLVNGDGLTRYGDPQPLGTYPYYSVLYNNVPGYFTFFVNGFEIVDWRHYSDFVPTYATISGEINTLATQMPGGYNTSEGFFDVNVWQGQWWPYDFFHPRVFPVNDNPSEFGQLAVSQTQAYIWDWRCSD